MVSDQMDHMQIWSNYWRKQKFLNQPYVRYHIVFLSKLRIWARKIGSTWQNMFSLWMLLFSFCQVHSRRIQMALVLGHWGLFLPSGKECSSLLFKSSHMTWVTANSWVKNYNYIISSLVSTNSCKYWFFVGI